MNPDPPRGTRTPPLAMADQIDRVCDRYEAAREAAGGSRIEEYLGEVTESGRSALLEELLASELEWRRRRGEHPTPEEYARRFPGDAALIAAAFDDRPTSGRAMPRINTTEAGRSGDGKTTEEPGSGAIRAGGEPVPGYRLRRCLGRGGFGEVWEAEAPGGVPVALKFVRLHDTQGASERRALETIKGIRHPNLLSLFGAWQAGELLVIGMELADRTLMDRFHQATAGGEAGIDGAELIEYLAEAAKGIDHLNEHIHALDNGPRRLGVQHRDIKPQNILLVGGGVKVADFGLARLLDQSVTGHTGSLTPAYAAPEFFENQTSDHSDQYSLAVSYCLLRGGRLPFTGGATAVMAGHLHHPPDLTMLPEAERPVVARALCKQPAGRWPDCRTFVAALRVRLSAEAPAPAPPAEKRRPRGRGLAVALVLALPAVGLVFWRTGLFSSSTPGPTPSLPGVHGQGGPSGKSPLRKRLRDVRQASSPADSKQGAAGHARTERETPVVADGAGQRDPQRAAPFLASGKEAYERGDFEVAIEAYSEAIWHDQSLARAYNDRGNAYLKLGHDDEAIEDYGMAIQFAPDDPAGYYNRGNAHYGRGQYQQAVSDYDRAIARAPTLEDAYFNRANAYEQLGDHERARLDREHIAPPDSNPR